VHYGSKERVDFAIKTDSLEAATSLATHLGERSPLLAVVADRLQTRSAEMSVEQNEVRGSVRVLDKEFDAWLAAVYARLSGGAGGRAEEVARVGAAH
jgi:hypothetical protein